MNRFLPQLDGGHDITRALFIFMPFINTSGFNKKATASFSDFFKVFSDVFFLICKIQMGILYFSSVLFKLQGSMWLNGTAMYYIIQIDEFYHPFFSNVIRNSDFLITITTYLTLLWELSYIFLIWTNEWRKRMISLAIIFHIGTINLMGLTTFGVAMIICNLIFLKDSEIIFIINKIKKKVQKSVEKIRKVTGYQ